MHFDFGIRSMNSKQQISRFYNVKGNTNRDTNDLFIGISKLTIQGGE